MSEAYFYSHSFGSDRRRVSSFGAHVSLVPVPLVDLGVRQTQLICHLLDKFAVPVDAFLELVVQNGAVLLADALLGQAVIG